MNASEEKNRPLRSRTFEGLESPFLDLELFAGHNQEEWEPRLGALKTETPFGRPFEEQEAPPKESYKEGIESEVFGSNDMDTVANTLALPYRWICRLDIEYEITPWGGTRKLMGHGTGTGTLVGPCHVLTAAHNVTGYDPVGRNYLRAVRIRATAAHDGSSSLPIPTVDVDLSKSHVHPMWRVPLRVDARGASKPTGEVETNRYDYALLTLTRTIGRSSVKALGGPLGYWSRQGSGGVAYFQRLEPGVLNKSSVTIAGYGSEDCVRAVRRARSNPAIPFGGQLMASGHLTTIWEGTPTNGFVDRSMIHNVDTCGGQSGAPVWLQLNGIYYLVGIHTGGVGLRGGGRTNHAVRVTGELMRQVTTWISTTSCPDGRGNTAGEETAASDALYTDEELLAPEHANFLEDFGITEREADENGLTKRIEVFEHPARSMQRDQLDLEEIRADGDMLVDGNFSEPLDLESLAGVELLEETYGDVDGPFPKDEPWLLEETAFISSVEDDAQDYPDEEQPAELFDELTEEINEKLALRSNAYYAKKLGWERYHDLIVSHLAKYWVASMWPDADFPRAVARWQKEHNLKDDGMLGPDSWNRMRALLCVGYEAGEKETARTQRGHLEPDVFMTKGGWLVIADFAIGDSTVKASTRREKLLNEWLAKFEANPPGEILTIGFTDCVGEENNNEALRRARAAEVAKLFGSKARAKARVFSGKMGKYLADNLTSNNRAMNRSVLIQWQQKVTFPPEEVSGDKAHMAARVLDCAAEAAGGIPGEEGERVRKMISIAVRTGYPKNLQLWFYNRAMVVDYFDWRNTGDKKRVLMTKDTGGKMPFDGYFNVGVPRQNVPWRIYPFQKLVTSHSFLAVDPCTPQIQDKMREDLLKIDFEMLHTINGIVQQAAMTTQGGGGLHKGGPSEFVDHMNDLVNSPDHLYSAFKK